MGGWQTDRQTLCSCLLRLHRDDLGPGKTKWTDRHKRSGVVNKTPVKCRIWPNLIKIWHNKLKNFTQKMKKSDPTEFDQILLKFDSIKFKIWPKSEEIWLDRKKFYAGKLIIYYFISTKNSKFSKSLTKLDHVNENFTRPDPAGWLDQPLKAVISESANLSFPPDRKVSADQEIVRRGSDVQVEGLVPSLRPAGHALRDGQSAVADRHPHRLLLRRGHQPRSHARRSRDCT